MADIARYHQTLARVMASYQPAPPTSKVIRSSIAHEYRLNTPFARCFPRFPELPIEIRLQIWEHCLPGPRAIEVDYGERLEYLYSKYPPPVALHVCRESRAEALKHYELAFDSRPNAACIYFDFSRDRLHFQHTDTFSGFAPDEMLRVIGEDLARVRFMSCCLHSASSFVIPYLPDLGKFKALEEITLLVPSGGHDGPDKIFVDPSTVTLSTTCSFRAVEFLEQDRDQVVDLWSNEDSLPLSTPKISIMSYVSGDYRVC